MNIELLELIFIIHRSRGNARNNTMRYGIRCDACNNYLANASKNFLKNKRGNFTAKYRLIDPVVKICDGMGGFGSTNALTHAANCFLKMQVACLSDLGKLLKSQLLILKAFYKKMQPKELTSKSSSNFIRDNFLSFYEKHGENFKNTLVHHLLEHAMKVMEGQNNAHLGEKCMDFFMMVSTASTQASRYCAANLFGPNIRTLRRHAKKVDLIDNTPPIINRTISECTDLLVNFIKDSFSLEDMVCFSLSIDGSAVARMARLHKRYNAIIGGATPNHFINIPDCGDDKEREVRIIEHTIRKFRGENPEENLASEVKLATVSFQSMNNQQCPYFQLAARPQTKNETSCFNQHISEACVKAETICCEDGWDVSFISAANDGVSYDQVFVQMTLISFLLGSITYTGLTDPNHNVKNGRYQMVIGGNSVKTIGRILIDTGLLICAKIALDLYRIKDFASDLLVLQLASAKTVSSLLLLPASNPSSLHALIVTLFFMRLHFFAVNSEFVIHAKTRVYMLWSFLIYMLHIDGVHHATKKNWLVSTISLSFIMLRSNIIRTHRVTSETSEHTIAKIRSFKREFTVSDIIDIIFKMDHLWMAMTRSQLLHIRNQNDTGGYCATLLAEENSDEYKFAGPVDIETNPDKISDLIDATD